MTIVLPIRLFAFEISLQKEARNKKQSFLTREEVIEIGKSLRLDDESDIDEALQYLHNVTIILYYHDVLPNIIFVDPEPILDVLSLLIAITYVEQSKLHLIAKVSNSERLRLKDCGLFEEDLLKKIGQRKKIFDQDFESSHMIKLLKHLHIIAEVKNKKEKEDDHHHIVTDTENKEKIEYFFPCALPSYDELKAPSTEIQPLLIAWEINKSGTIRTESLAIPQGLFPLTIVHLLEREDVDFNERFYRCLDAMSLCVNDEYTINIINRCTHIEIRFYDEKKYCSEIRKLVEDAIKNSGNDLKVSKKYSLVFAFKCPQNEQSYCIVKEDNSSTRCKCQPQCKVLQGDDDNSYRCWFSDYQSSSPGTKASSEDPPTKKRRLELTTDASPAQPHQDSTTVNPDSDGAGQLSKNWHGLIIMPLIIFTFHQDTINSLAVFPNISTGNGATCS
ncbi:PREDICTED: uncharacterized protein LOC109589930 isoform X1 [Amphimedon queenslandica]|uniref:COR domain-containing protein n=1 Tax=Amphimedon queenslandica TaxID=400682 RepID=A0AAN0JX35_AMPQE|nr:PREDICTED: uncharacterized protein LOC109589930 isoform X1 [Amphimedon queenslandica]|eukprot:XP_019861465.1 PREDICTED: uncharacterized protein LOC109589930 isoform X1 [Amphimedon queenslandica]